VRGLPSDAEDITFAVVGGWKSEVGADGAIKMMSWRRLRRERIAWADTVGDAFIAEFGIDAYSNARRLERDATNPDLTSHWNHVAQTIARKTRRGIGLNTAASKTRAAAKMLG
jgi:hypothetical protein